MGPNLTRLFELSKSNMAGPEEWEAPFKLEQLFQAHGEALIAALEAIVNTHHTLETYDAAMKEGRRVLAQLESEAQP